MPPRPCTVCGEPHHGAGRCPDCARAADARRPRASATSRGYNARWERLSAKARRLQPFCSDCGTREDLTCDHSPEAWDRIARGLAVRLRDVDVVCRGCNARRGAARGPLSPQGRHPLADPSRTPPVRQENDHTPSHIMGSKYQEVEQ